MASNNFDRSEIGKAPTGIAGLDEITYGGIPAGRPTLVSGGPGSGKTLLGVSFLVNGAQSFAEPGVLLTFEENADELAQDVRSLGYDLHKLVEQKKLLVDYIHVDRSEIEETGEYDLEGLFVRLEHAIKQIGARRVMLDTIETRDPAWRLGQRTALPIAPRRSCPGGQCFRLAHFSRSLRSGFPDGFPDEF